MANLLDNPFLVLGVSADADMALIKGVSDRILFELRLNGYESSATARRVEQAIEELRDPVKRFYWGLYWPELSPRESELFSEDPILSSLAENPRQNGAGAYERFCEPRSETVRAHNLGALALVRAICETRHAQDSTPDEVEDDLECRALWDEAFRHLEPIVDSEEFWIRQRMRAKELDDPRLDSSFIDSCRTGFLDEIIAPVGDVISTALVQRHADVASVYVDLLRQSGFDQDAIETSLSLVYKPLADRVEHEINELESELDSVARRSASESDFSQLFDRFKNEAYSDLQVMLRVGDLPGYAEEHARDTAAQFLRDLGVSAWNSAQAAELAKTATALAGEIADAASLKTRVQEDRAALKRIEERATAHDLDLEIRSDRVQIDSGGVRYRSDFIKSDDLWGMTFGISKQYTNGIQTSCSYLVSFGSRDGRQIDIECKRTFRKEKKAKEDYGAILDSALHHLAPGIIERVADSIMNGKPFDPGGGCLLTKAGIEFSTGMLMWKKEHTIPYSQLRLQNIAGALRVSSSKDSKLMVLLDNRAHWNAVLLEYIAKAILTR